MERGSYTWHEIGSQPAAWRSTLEKFTAGRDALQEFLATSAVGEVVVIGCGSTHYLAQSAAALLRHGLAVPVRALPASELWLFSPMAAVPVEPCFDHEKNNGSGETLLVAVSRSGSTTETLRALARFQEAGAGPVLAVTCYPDSPLAQRADFALVAPDAQEHSVAQTRSFTSMFLLAQALSATLACDDEGLEHLRLLPDALEGLIDRVGSLPQELGADLDVERLFFLGGGPLYGLASEAMLKTKEMTLSYAEAYYPLEFRHGPMSMVDERTLVVGFLSDTGLEQELHVLKDMQGLGARVLALVEDDAVFADWRADYVVELHSGLSEWERGPLYLPVIQWLAYHRAVAKGLNPDRPHNLEAVVEL